MAIWVLNFTKGGTKDKKQLALQARKLLEVGLWGIRPGNRLKGKMKPGDPVLAFAGAPERVFVGAATLTSGWHEWTPEEWRRYRGFGTFEGGFALRDASVWSQALPLFPVWEQTQAAETNPKARWFSGVVALTDTDGELILDAAPESAPSGPPPEAPEAEV